MKPFQTRRRPFATQTRRNRRPIVESLEGRTLLTAGALDTSFGGTGTVITNATTVTASNAQTQYASGTVVLPDLTTVVVGVTPETYQTGSGHNSLSTHLDILVARYNPDGSLDQAFGSGGLVRIRSAVDYWSDSTEPHLISVALQSTSSGTKLVIAGDTKATYSSGKNSSVTRYDLYITRMNLDGTIDTTFNKTGSETVDFTQGDVFAEGVAVQPDGKIVVGADSGASGLHFLAVRLNANGGLDSAFGPTGHGYVGLASGTAQGMTLDGAGNILLVGNDHNSAINSTVMAVVRYTPAGLADSTFGQGGEALVSIGPSYGYAIGLQSTGQIVASGDLPGGGGVVRLNANGSMDSSFGSNGAFIDTSLFHPMAITVQPNDEILLAGKGPLGGSSFAYFVDRLQAGGQLDTSFGVGGQTQAYFSGMSDAQPLAATIGPDGKITVTGVVDYYQGGVYWNRLGTARFLNDISSNTSVTAASALARPATSTSTPLADQTLLILGPSMGQSPTFGSLLLPFTKKRSSH